MGMLGGMGSQLWIGEPAEQHQPGSQDSDGESFYNT